MNVLCGCNSKTILIVITANKVTVLPYISKLFFAISCIAKNKEIGILPKINCY